MCSLYVPCAPCHRDQLQRNLSAAQHVHSVLLTVRLTKLCSLPFRLFFLEGLEESKELQKSPRGVKSVLETLEESTEPGREPLGVISGH
jgi:hypothetical protein